jgi:hypothetical protein
MIVVVSDALNNAAASFPDWHISGSNTLRYDRYHTGGSLNASPYRFGGGHSYDELNLSFDRNLSPYNRITGQLSGLLYNDSRYRSQFPGTVLERFNLKQENGEFLVPYRVEAGDVFAFQSYRTIQRSLKGAQLEFQPTLGWGRHSISLFSGTSSATWDNFQWKDNQSQGVSWLVEHPGIGLASANLVISHKQANGFATPGQKQYVYSLAWEKRAEVWGEKLTMEAEGGRFVGDHSDLFGAGSGANRQGYAFFSQISGSPTILPALGYRARYEAYDQDYRPNGAAIQPDRRSEEGHLSWRFTNGLTARARLQNFHTAWKTNNPTDSITYGGNLSGPVPGVAGLSGTLDAFDQVTESRDLTTNTVTKAINASLSKSLTRQLSLRAGAYYANTRDRNNTATGHSITRQLNVGLDSRMEIMGFRGTISPGVLVRGINQQGSKRSRDFTPTLNINAARGAHNVSMSLSAQDQGRPQTNLGVVTRTAGLNYRYTQKRYSAGVEANWYERNPDNASPRTDAWRVGAFLTLNVDKPARIAPPANVAAQETDASGARLSMDITRIKPGMKSERVKSLLKLAGLGQSTSQAGYLLWFNRIFRELDQIQRLAVDISAGRATRSAVIIEFDDVGDSGGMQRAFGQARRILLQQYGQPDLFFDQGDFGPNLDTELAAGRFVRTMEWKHKDGTLRFGIPRRLDNRIRMELQFGRSFPILKDTLWSLEQVQ